MNYTLLELKLGSPLPGKIAEIAAPRSLLSTRAFSPFFPNSDNAYTDFLDLISLNTASQLILFYLNPHNSSYL